MEDYELETIENEYCGETIISELSSKNEESKSYILSLDNNEFELTMKLDEKHLYFKLESQDIISNCYYEEYFDLINLNKLLSTCYKDIKEVFHFCDEILNQKKVNLIELKYKNKISLNFKNKINNGNTIESNLELTQFKLSRDEFFNNILKEINSLKKKLKSNNEKSKEELKAYVNSKIKETKQEYIKILEDKDNEIKSIKEELIKIKKEQENILKQIQNKDKNKYNEILGNLKPMLNEWKTKIYKEMKELNDNVNLINNFKSININKMKVINSLSNKINLISIKSVAVYKISKNDYEELYELAYPENKDGYNIIIYNLLLNKKISQMKNSHSGDIHTLKHYYEPLSKRHILLTSSFDKSVKLWNRTTNQISCILHLQNCFDGDNNSPFCLMFNNEDYYIFGGAFTKKKNIWNKSGDLIGPIEKSNINCGGFIETAYIENEPYILLAGAYHSECYDYKINAIKQYKSKNYENLVINLLNKNNMIYLLTGDDHGNIIIYDFSTTLEIGSISVGGWIYSICSLNERYILVGNTNKELKVIDLYNKAIIKNYQEHKKEIAGIEKIKTNEKEEFIITYDRNEIIIWK